MTGFNGRAASLLPGVPFPTAIAETASIYFARTRPFVYSCRNGQVLAAFQERNDQLWQYSIKLQGPAHKCTNPGVFVGLRGTTSPVPDLSIICRECTLIPFAAFSIRQG
jgi:hypothetical protein